MWFSNEDKILIKKNWHDSKQYGTKNIMKEFPEKVRTKVNSHGASRYLHCGTVYYQRQIRSVDKLKWWVIDVWCSLEQSSFHSGEEDFERVSVLKKYSLLTMLIVC